MSAFTILPGEAPERTLKRWAVLLNGGINADNIQDGTINEDDIDPDAIPVPGSQGNMFYNNGGVLGATSDITYDGTDIAIANDLTVGGDISAPGNDDEVLFNNNGVIAGASNVQYDGSDLLLSNNLLIDDDIIFQGNVNRLAGNDTAGLNYLLGGTTTANGAYIRLAGDTSSRDGQALIRCGADTGGYAGVDIGTVGLQSLDLTSNNTNRVEVKDNGELRIHSGQTTSSIEGIHDWYDVITVTSSSWQTVAVIGLDPDEGFGLDLTITAYTTNWFGGPAIITQKHLYWAYRNGSANAVAGGGLLHSQDSVGGPTPFTFRVVASGTGLYIQAHTILGNGTDNFRCCIKARFTSVVGVS